MFAVTNLSYLLMLGNSCCLKSLIILNFALIRIRVREGLPDRRPRTEARFKSSVLEYRESENMGMGPARPNETNLAGKMVTLEKFSPFFLVSHC